MSENSSNRPRLRLSRFIADLIGSGIPIIQAEDVQKDKLLASGSTFTVYSGMYRSKVFAVKYFNTVAPSDLFSSISVEIAGENLRTNLVDATHEIRIMSNNVLRACPNIATLNNIFFETEDAAWIRPAFLMDLACDLTPTLTLFLKTPQSPLMKRSLVMNIFDGVYALHSTHVCHGDVKPDNVLIFPSTENPEIPYQARISDFGYAFINGQTPRGVGTDGWCAPECYDESQEPLIREFAYGRDIYSAALVMREVFRAPFTAYPHDDEHPCDSFDLNSKLNIQIQTKFEPQMLSERPEKRPWMEDIRVSIRDLCDEYGVENLQWSWVANEATMVHSEIVPITMSNQFKGRISTWLVTGNETNQLPTPVQQAILREFEAGSADAEDPDRADHHNALYACYTTGRLASKDSQKAWYHLWEAARAGHKAAQAQAMYYTILTSDLNHSTQNERRDWSIATLLGDSSASSYSSILLRSADPEVCERGLRTAIFEKYVTLDNRQNRKYTAPSLAQVVENVLEPQHRLLITHIIPNIDLALSRNDFPLLQGLLRTNVSNWQVQDLLLQPLLEWAIVNRRKQIIHFIYSHYSDHLQIKSERTIRDAFIVAVFNESYESILWLIDHGIDRTALQDSLLFGRVVCNSSWTMTITFIEACPELSRHELLNNGTPSMQTIQIPPPIILSTLAGNFDSCMALNKHSVNVNQSWDIWTPLMLAVAQGLPHFAAHLIGNGAKLAERTTDESKRSLCHILADADAVQLDNMKFLLQQALGWTPTDYSKCPVLVFSKRRYCDNLLFELLVEAGVSFTDVDGFGRSALEVAVRSGKIWVASLLLQRRRMNMGEISVLFQGVPDVDGRHSLFYSIEDGNSTFAEEQLKQGYDINHKDNLGRTILHEAVQRAQHRAVSFCFDKGANAFVKDNSGCTALNFAIANDDIDMCKAIVSLAGSRILLERTISQETFIHHCLKANRYSVLLVLLDMYIAHQKADGLPSIPELLGYSDFSKRTCLHYLCGSDTAEHDSTGLIYTVLDRILTLSTPDSCAGGDNDNSVSDEGSESLVSRVDCIKETALHVAVQLSSSSHSTTSNTTHTLRCVAALVDAGVDVNARNEVGNTALHYAYETRPIKQEVIDVLVDSGRADEQVKNDLGFNPREWGRMINEEEGDSACLDTRRKLRGLFRERSALDRLAESVAVAEKESTRVAFRIRQDLVESPYAEVFGIAHA